MAALVAPLMSGFVIDHYGAAWLWGACAVVGMIAALGYWPLMRSLDTGTGGGTAGPAASPPVEEPKAVSAAGTGPAA